MHRLQRAVVLLSLLEQLKERGSWCGEAHLQKATYFLQELLGVPLGFDFILYKHGPYAFDLGDEITALRADNLLTLQTRRPAYGPSIVPAEASRALLDRYPKARSLYGRPAAFVAEQLGGKNAEDGE
jgi:hypothetical protein